MLLQLFGVFFVLWVVIKRWKMRRMIALANQLKAKRIALPLIGHGYIFLGSNEDRMQVLTKIGEEAIESGGVISHWQGDRLYIMIADPAAAEVVLKTCLEKDDVMRFSRILIGNGSIFAPVSTWRPRRKIAAPIFSPRNLNYFVEIFARQSSVMVEQLKQAAGNGAFSVWKYVTTYTMDSVCETTLGIKINAQLQPSQPFLKSFENCSSIDAGRMCQPWFHNDTLFKLACNHTHNLHTDSKNFIWDFMNKIITSKWESMKKLDSKPDRNHRNGLKPFLELLIESSSNGTSYSNIELREETLVIVLAGTDTSAVGTAFTTVMLARHPDVQEKIYEELQDVFGDSYRLVTAEDLPRLKYLEAVIKETLRLYPPAPFVVRKVDKDVTLPSGITLVEGCGLIISILAIHRNQQYWGSDPDVFRPERFLDGGLTHPAAFIPFSHGPRSCLGYQYAMMSMKTALATLLLRYRVLPPNGQTTQHKPLRLKFDVMMKDVDGWTIQLDLRR